MILDNLMKARSHRGGSTAWKSQSFSVTSAGLGSAFSQHCHFFSCSGFVSRAIYQGRLMLTLCHMETVVLALT